MSNGERIARALRSADPEERRLAIRALGANWAPMLTPELLRGLRDADWRVRKEAALVAGRLAHCREVTEALVESLGPSERDVGMRNAVVEALAGHGQQALLALTEALDRVDADGRKLVAEVLGRLGSGEALKMLQLLLKDADPNVRMAALEGLSVAGECNVEAVAPVLLACVDGEDSLLQLVALDGLNHLGVVLPWERVQPWLELPALERAAVEASARCESTATFPALRARLHARRRSVRDSALQALAQVVRRSVNERRVLKELFADATPEEVRHLVGLARDGGSLEARAAAITLLAGIGFPEAVDLVLDALVETGLVETAETALLLLGSRTLPALLQRLHDGDEEQRAAYVEALLGMSSDGVPLEVRDSVLGLVFDPAPRIRRAALQVLARKGDSLALERLLAAEGTVHSEDLSLWLMAIGSLARRHEAVSLQLLAHGRCQPAGAVALAHACAPVGGPQEAKALEVLIDGTRHEHPHVRAAALEGLAVFSDTVASEAVDLAMLDEEFLVRRVAVRVLATLRSAEGGHTGVARLMQLLDEAEPELLPEVLVALGCARTKEADERLLALAASPEPLLAVTALESLEGAPEALRCAAVRAALRHPSSEVLRVALSTAVELGEVELVPGIVAILDGEEPEVRALAAEALGGFVQLDLSATLRERLQVETDGYVQEQLRRAVSLHELSTIPPARGIRQGSLHLEGRAPVGVPDTRRSTT